MNSAKDRKSEEIGEVSQGGSFRKRDRGSKGTVY